MKKLLTLAFIAATLGAKAQQADTTIVVTFTKQAWAAHQYIVGKTTAEYNVVQEYYKFLGQAAQVIPPTQDTTKVFQSTGKFTTNKFKK